MKKLIALVLAALMLISLLAACGKPEPEEKLPDTTVETPEETPEETPDAPEESPEVSEEEITTEEPDIAPEEETAPEAVEPGTDEALATLLTDIYAIKAPEFMTAEMPFDLSDPDNLRYYTGLSDASLITSAIVSESAMGSQAYSLVLVRAADASKVAEIAEAMESGIDPRKWICVEADDLRVVAAGDIVMLIMIDSSFADSITADDMVEAFKQASGMELVVE